MARGRWLRAAAVGVAVVGASAVVLPASVSRADVCVNDVCAVPKPLDTTDFVGDEHVVSVLTSPGTRTDFSIESGPDAGLGLTATADDQGVASFPYTGRAPGADEINVCIVVGASQGCQKAWVRWVLPPPPPPPAPAPAATSTPPAPSDWSCPAGTGMGVDGAGNLITDEAGTPLCFEGLT